MSAESQVEREFVVTQIAADPGVPEESMALIFFEGVRPMVIYMHGCNGDNPEPLSRALLRAGFGVDAGCADTSPRRT